MKYTIGAGEFKAKCLQIMDQVHQYHSSVVITKHGKPIAKLVPYQETPPKSGKLFGAMKGSVSICGDIVSPIDEIWSAENDD